MVMENNNKFQDKVGKLIPHKLGLFKVIRKPILAAGACNGCSARSLGRSCTDVRCLARERTDGISIIYTKLY